MPSLYSAYHPTIITVFFPRSHRFPGSQTSKSACWHCCSSRSLVWLLVCTWCVNRPVVSPSTSERCAAPYGVGPGDWRPLGHADPLHRFPARQALQRAHAEQRGGEFSGEAPRPIPRMVCFVCPFDGVQLDRVFRLMGYSRSVCRVYTVLRLSPGRPCDRPARSLGRYE